MSEIKNSTNVKVSTPQSLAELDSTLEVNKIKRNTIVAAKVICWDSKNKGLIVVFGNQIKGFIPEEHISIYPSKDRGKIPSEATYIIGKTVIAEVIDYNKNKTEFTLSRTNAMKKRVQEIKPTDKISSYVTNVREKDIFVDLGAGIMGRVYYAELTSCYIEDVAYLGYHVGSIIELQVIDMQDNKVNLSRRRLYSEYDMSKINTGDIVEAKILSELTVPITTISYPYAYCVEVDDNANVKGIIDSFIPLTKGSIVTCSVRKVTERGVQLNLIAI